jgi:protein-S-isoprenylcysteine O-methyltransferase Ste14
MQGFDYFQIASVTAFLVVIIGRALFMRFTKGIRAIVIGGGKTGFVLVVEVLSFAGLALWVIEILFYALHSEFRIFPSPLDNQLINSVPAKFAGCVLIAFGFVIFLLAFLSFGDSWRVGFDMKTPGTLVTKGIFALSRNPIYVFLLCWFLGIFLINGTAIFLIFALLALAVVHWQILQEERFLKNLYGQAYQDYYERTARYLFW